MNVKRCAGLAALLIVASACSTAPQAGLPRATADLRPHWSPLAALVSGGLRAGGPMQLRGVSAPAALRSGLYVSQFYGQNILGYHQQDRHDRGPVCTVTGNFVNGIAVDDAGNLIDPDGGTHSIIIYQGPDMCGPPLATIDDPYGQPGDASSFDSLHGKIALANIFDNNSAPGSVSVCTVAKGCTRNLTNPAMYEVAGVAMDKRGNCWASAIGAYPKFTPALVYFAKCSGGGIVASGWRNAYYGGLEVDPAGNLIAIDPLFNTTGRMFVYSGCDPACKVVGGPFPTYDASIFGHLNKKATLLALLDFYLPQIDIYQYSPTRITYLYSFKNGIDYTLGPIGIAYNPRAP